MYQQYIIITVSNAIKLQCKVWTAAAREEVNARGGEEEAETPDGQTDQKHSIINKPF